MRSSILKMIWKTNRVRLSHLNSIPIRSFLLTSNMTLR